VVQARRSTAYNELVAPGTMAVYSTSPGFALQVARACGVRVAASELAGFDAVAPPTPDENTSPPDWEAPRCLSRSQQGRVDALARTLFGPAEDEREEPGELVDPRLFASMGSASTMTQTHLSGASSYAKLHLSSGGTFTPASWRPSGGHSPRFSVGEADDDHEGASRSRFSQSGRPLHSPHHHDLEAAPSALKSAARMSPPPTSARKVTFASIRLDPSAQPAEDDAAAHSTPVRALRLDAGTPLDRVVVLSDGKPFTRREASRHGLLGADEAVGQYIGFETVTPRAKKGRKTSSKSTPVTSSSLSSASLSSSTSKTRKQPAKTKTTPSVSSLSSSSSASKTKKPVVTPRSGRKAPSQSGAAGKQTATPRSGRKMPQQPLPPARAGAGGGRTGRFHRAATKASPSKQHVLAKAKAMVGSWKSPGGTLRALKRPNQPVAVSVRDLVRQRGKKPQAEQEPLHIQGSRVDPQRDPPKTETAPAFGMLLTLGGPKNRRPPADTTLEVKSVPLGKPTEPVISDLDSLSSASGSPRDDGDDAACIPDVWGGHTPGKGIGDALSERSHCSDLSSVSGDERTPFRGRADSHLALSPESEITIDGDDVARSSPLHEEDPWGNGFAVDVVHSKVEVDVDGGLAAAGRAGRQVRRTVVEECFDHVFARNERAVFQRLMSGEVDASDQNDDSLTLLHATSAMGLDRLVEALVRRFGADVDVQTVGGDTPMHFAIQGGHTSTARLLQRLGANPLLENVSGVTSLDLRADV
jgi:hypothetical protein